MSKSRIHLSSVTGEQNNRLSGQLPPWLQGMTVLLVPVVLIAVWGALTSFYTVQPEQQAVVKRFGQVHDIRGPGLHTKIPFGVDTVELVATERVLKEEFGFRSTGVRDSRTTYSTADFTDESLMLTGDLNIIEVEWVVQYRIQDPIKFLYELREPQRTLRDLSESVMRRVVGNRMGSDVLTVGRVEISQMVRDELQNVLDRYDSGLHIITVEMQDVVPPTAVRPAFNEVNESRQERERMINEATKQANQRIPRAEGEARRRVAEAEGYATERVNRAMGEVARFSAMLEQYRDVPEVTRTRLYLEAMNEVLPKVGQILVVQDEQAGPLPLMNIQSRQAQPAGQREGGQ